jgi:hypothetical protein
MAKAIYSSVNRFFIWSSYPKGFSSNERFYQIPLIPDETEFGVQDKSQLWGAYTFHNLYLCFGTEIDLSTCGSQTHTNNIALLK